MPALRLLVAEDQVLLREGVVRILRDLGFDVVGEAGDATELLRLGTDLRPDVVVADVQMPPGGADDGLRAAERLRRQRPGTGVLILSQHLDEAYALGLLGRDAHGCGYLLKERIADVESLGEAVRRVAAGGTVLDPDVVERMLAGRRRDDDLAGLTARERDVLALMAEGRSNPGIAAELGVTPAAVEKHATGIFGKLGLGREPGEHRRVKAVLAWVRSH